MIVSEKALGSWLSQVTTGHGAAVIVGTIASVLSGSVAWPAALPMLLGGVVLTIWPEQTKLASQASDALASAEKVATAAIALESAAPKNTSTVP